MPRLHPLCHYICLLILSLLIASGCNEKKAAENPWQHFLCRDEGSAKERKALYRAKVSPAWKRLENNSSVKDTMTPICEFIMGEDPSSIHLTIHTFPVDDVEKRVPPEAQITRWKRQFDYIEQETMQIEPCAHGGFIGYSLKATGAIKEKTQKMLAFSMQLGFQHLINLKGSNSADDFFRHIAADYTIKAIGTPQNMQIWESDLETFANSFELIEDLPAK